MATKPIYCVGHGELLKALSARAENSHIYFRVAVCYLSFIKPPVYKAYPSAETVAKAAYCSVRTVQRAKTWMVEKGIAKIEEGGGRSKTSIVDFTPLTEQVISDRRGRVSRSERASETAINGANAVSVSPLNHSQEVAPNSDQPVSISNINTVTPDCPPEAETVTHEARKSDSAPAHEGPKKNFNTKGQAESAETIRLADAIPLYLKKLRSTQ